MIRNPLMSQFVIGLPYLWEPAQASTPPGLDLSAFINFADLSLIEAAVTTITTKPQQQILDAVSSGIWLDMVDSYNLLSSTGNPVNGGNIATFRSVTSNDTVTAVGSLMASRLANRVRFNRDHYLGNLQHTPTMTYVLVGRQLRSTRAEYLYTGGHFVALGVGNPRHRIAYRDVSGQWRVSTGFVPNNNNHMLSWQMDNDKVRFYYDAVMSDEFNITPIPIQTVNNAAWFGQSRNGQCNFDGYGLFVTNQPVDIADIHCFADRFYNLGLGLG